MQRLNNQKYPLRHKWDFRTGSPHRVFRVIQDVVEELGYTTQLSKQLELKPSPITDTATFEAEVKGEMQMPSHYHWGAMLLGILAIVIAIPLFIWAMGTLAVFDLEGIILALVSIGLFIFGIATIATTSHTCKRMLLVKMEGEAYKASAKVVEWAEATDVVADVRIIVSATVAWFASGQEIEKGKIKDTDRRILEEDFRELLKRIEAVLPSFMMR